MPDLDLKKRTRVYALKVIRLYSLLPHSTVAQVIGKQLLRSGTSVGANFREAQRARSRTEFAAKLNLSLMELEESSYWIELLRESKVAGSQSNELAALYSESLEMCAIFVTLIKRTRLGIGGKSAEVRG